MPEESKVDQLINELIELSEAIQTANMTTHIYIGQDADLANREAMLGAITPYVSEVLTAAKKSGDKLLELKSRLDIERDDYWEMAKQQGYELGFEDCVNKETSKRY